MGIIDFDKGVKINVVLVWIVVDLGILGVVFWVLGEWCKGIGGLLESIRVLVCILIIDL